MIDLNDTLYVNGRTVRTPKHPYPSKEAQILRGEWRL